MNFRAFRVGNFLASLFVLMVFAPAVARAQATRPASIAAPPSTRPAQPSTWRGPDGDFHIVDGKILGPWWQGGGPAVVYFTGPAAQRSKNFVHVGSALAEKAGRPYLEIGKESLQPSDDDANGILAYPDGTARVRLLMLAGGNAFNSMCEIAGISKITRDAAVAERGKFVEARKVPQAAFKSGMNYVGACAGCFAAASGFDVKKSLYADWGLWPGKIKELGPSMQRPLPDVIFDPAMKDHPLFKATDGGTLKNMYFNGGPLGPQDKIPDTEYLGKYEGGGMPELPGNWFLIAYRPKDNPLAGRCVITTGHPEVNHPAFLLAMATYALDHEYEVTTHVIQPGQPVQGVSGDDQVQYFSVKVDAGKKLTITLTGLDENCDLYLRENLPPTFAKHDDQSTNTGLTDERIIVPATHAATYFIAVHGKHAVLNGAKYSLNVAVE